MFQNINTHYVFHWEYCIHAGRALREVAVVWPLRTYRTLKKTYGHQGNTLPSTLCIHGLIHACACSVTALFCIRRYGLKGKVDVSVTIKERRKSLTTETTRVPLELKTGKMFRTQGTIQHRAQVRVPYRIAGYFRGMKFSRFSRLT